MPTRGPADGGGGFSSSGASSCGALTTTTAASGSRHGSASAADHQRSGVRCGAADPGLAAAREQAFELGISAVSGGCGAGLRVIAAVSNAKSVVEVGTGTGVSGGWLLRGMRRDGVLTTIDFESEHQRIARRV